MMVRMVTAALNHRAEVRRWASLAVKSLGVDKFNLACAEAEAEQK